MSTPGVALHLVGGRVIDPARKVDAPLDVLIEDGVVTQVGARLAVPAGLRTVDVRGLWVLPGLIDIHVHLREPGQEYKEDIATGTASAAAGGFTAICCMPNTRPPNDNRAVTELIVRRAREVGKVRVYPIGAITQGLAGEHLAEMGELQEAGCVAVSDDGRPVMNAEVMRRAFEYARGFGLTVIQHCEDLCLSNGGAMNEGAVATRAGIRAQPAVAESAMVARDLELCALTGARYHVAHISAAESIRLVRQAKAQGLPVTAEVTPHHVTLTDAACATYDSNTKMNPPLRGARDVEAAIEGLADGTIDCIATDHAPHSPVEKDVEFEQASFGVVGLETAVPLTLRLVRAGRLPVAAWVDRLTAAPARVLGLPGGRLGVGDPGDVVVIDPETDWFCTADVLRSRSKNSPFLGQTMTGAAALTVVGGRIVFQSSAHEERFRE
jgi:dihydroorotase